MRMSDEETVRRFWALATEATADARREHEMQRECIEREESVDLLLDGNDDVLPSRIDAMSDLADAWTRAADAWRAVAMADAMRQRAAGPRA
jgi:hypothetical protein